MMEQTEILSTQPATNQELMIEFRHVYFSVGDFKILHDINLKIPKSTAAFMIGTSGAGKSTVLKLILGLIKPDSGEIYVEGEEISSYTEEELMPVRRKLGMVFQESALFDSLTVRENVGYVLYERAEMSDEEIYARVVELLTLVEIEEMIDKMPSELSGGQRRRVAIARAMAANPKIILYDEPTAGLDPVTSNTIIKQMIKLREFFGVTSIVVTHKLEDCFKMSYNIVVREGDEIHMVRDESGRRLRESKFHMIQEGRIVFEGNADQFLASTDPYVKEFQL